MPAAVAERPAPAVGRLVLPVAVGAGALVAVQQRLNGQLKGELGDAVLTAVVSFGSGLLCVAAVLLARPASRRALVRLRKTRPWERLGGLGGALLVAVGAAAAPTLGVALLTVGIVAGQTGGALVVDRVGLGPGGRRALTGPRLLGALLCVAAVAVSVLGQGARQAAPLLLALVAVAGFGTSVQQALNGRVRGTTGDPVVATCLNFAVGTAALLAGLAVRAAVTGVHVAAWPGPGQGWLYLGGLVGTVFVGISSVAVRELGVLRLGLATVAGQLLGAVLLDGLVPERGTSLSLSTVAGAGLTLVAALVSGRTPS